ncbi:MAG: hypothetical protein E7A62_09505 [Actinomycetaceae bacterium]|nr:hypothetical protein [Actinomycetaceae bacterium]MDU0971206.1 hypothetical protein [Actinomycetaceae bacterium]
MPLVLDVADDLYAEELTRIDEDAGFAFTAAVTSIGALLGTLYRHATGWSQMAGAAGAMAGSWLALALDTQHHPVPAIALACLLYGALAVWLVRGRALPEIEKALSAVPGEVAAEL